jgi:hypothetical protein
MTRSTGTHHAGTIPAGRSRPPGEQAPLPPPRPPVRVQLNPGLQHIVGGVAQILGAQLVQSRSQCAHWRTISNTCSDGMRSASHSGEIFAKSDIPVNRAATCFSGWSLSEPGRYSFDCGGRAGFDSRHRYGEWLGFRRPRGVHH